MLLLTFSLGIESILSRYLLVELESSPLPGPGEPEGDREVDILAKPEKGQAVPPTFDKDSEPAKGGEAEAEWGDTTPEEEDPVYPGPPHQAIESAGAEEGDVPYYDGPEQDQGEPDEGPVDGSPDELGPEESGLKARTTKGPRSMKIK